MSLLELLELPEGTTLADGAPARPFARLPFSGRVRIGSGDGALRVPGLRPEAYAELESAREPHCGEEARVHVNGSVVRLELARSSGAEPAFVVFRVVDAHAPRVTWPRTAKSRLLEGAAPGSETLAVLGDALLEEGEPLGQRLAGLLASASDETHWLAQLGPLVELGAADVGWSRGVAESLTLRGEALAVLPALSILALTHLVQRLDLVPWPVASFDAAEALKRLDPGALPWLTTLRVHHLEPSAAKALERTVKRDPTLEAVAPRLAQCGAGSATALVLAGDGERRRLGEQALVVGAAREGRLVSTVRLWGRVPVLLTGTKVLVLNGRARQRPLDRSAWAVAVKEGDVFALDGVEYVLEPA
jgi:hypothetical protein